MTLIETLYIAISISSLLLIVLSALFLSKRHSITNDILSEIKDKVLMLEGDILSGVNTALDNQDKQSAIIYNSISQQLLSSASAQKNQLDVLYQQMGQISQLNEAKMDAIRRTLNENINRLQDENSKKLDEIRSTVGEKLQSTLEKRLGESFKIVSERLEMVYKGLGEMQNLASGVGDLKRVLNNVKTRGIWGEAQLDAILQQIMTPGQYAANVAVRDGSQDRVEYAIKLPGKEDNSTIWLPIDAKFPLDDYQRLIEAQEVGDLLEVDKQSKILESSLKKSAKTISEKYIHPPYTTDFAIMFLPIEGLYAEALRKAGMVETMQREFRVVITSPTTLSAILNSLQMGFKTMAIEKHSSNIWRVLESIKPEFVKFADLLSKTKVKLDQASQAISDAEVRTRAIQRKLDKAEVPVLQDSKERREESGLLDI